MTFAISNDARTSNVARSQGSCQQQEQARQPMNLFGGDKLGSDGGSGLFPKGAGGAGTIDELLAKLSKKDKNQCFDTGSASNNLFSGGKDFGSAGAGDDKGGGGKGGGGGLQQALGAVMGIIQKILPMLGGMLGGL